MPADLMKSSSSPVSLKTADGAVAITDVLQGLHFVVLQ